MKVKSRNMLRVPGWFNQVKKAVRSRITHKIYQSFAPVLISIKMSNTRIIDSKIELPFNQFAIWLMREQIVTEPIWRPSHLSRVRGLKWWLSDQGSRLARVAPFTGAWIEINKSVSKYLFPQKVAPFTGAWIEMISLIKSARTGHVAPFTGAWIEIFLRDFTSEDSIWSHPSRVRGLK